MLESTAPLIALIIISIVLAGTLALRPSITSARAGKILAFVALLVFPVMAGTLGTTEHLKRSTSTQFCLSCHIMEDYGKSLRIDDREYMPAVHYQNNLIPRDHACYTCHTNYAMFGGVQAKIKGLKHVYVNYFGTAEDPIKLYEPYNNRECLHCHLGGRSFEEGATHLQEDGHLDAMKRNELSCSSSGCHSLIHNVKGLKDLQFWEGEVK